MNILDTFLLTYKKNQVHIPKRELLFFAISALREAERLEQQNTGSPGKVAIEFLLNMKYKVVENRVLESHIKDVMLSEIDSVINKVVAKYRIKRKGKNFYFDESLAIVDSTIIPPVGTDLLGDLYAANTELEILKIQLTRTNLNSSDCFRLKAAILDQEKKIAAIKLAIIKQKCFSHVDDQKGYNAMYRRSLGETILSR